MSIIMGDTQPKPKGQILKEMQDCNVNDNSGIILKKCLGGDKRTKI